MKQKENDPRYICINKNLNSNNKVRNKHDKL